MKKLHLVLAFILLSVLVISCKKEGIQTTPQTPEENNYVFSRGAGGSADGTEQPVDAVLYAGQNINAGTIHIENDADSIYITYTVTNGYTLTATHLYVGSFDAIPVSGGGNPVPGQFPYSGTHDYLTTYTYAVPVSAIGNVGDCGVVAAHAVVVKRDSSGNITSQQTAWGAGRRISNHNWGTATPYCIY